MSLGLALCSAGIAFMPLPAANAAFVERPPLREVARSPLFWLGAAVLGVIAVQALNPAWRYVSNSQDWWLQPVAHVPWLPRGVDAPFTLSNSGRALVILGSVWLQTLAVWIGLRRRRSFHLLFSILVANAALLVVLEILQALTGASGIFWDYTPSSGSFVASFIYRNHAGAYFNLMVALAASLGWWHFRQAQKTHAKSSPAALLAFIAAGIALVVVLSASRMSIANLVAFLGLTVLLIVVRRLRKNRQGFLRADLIVLWLALAGIGGVVVLCVEVDKVRERILHLVEDPRASSRDRALVAQASIEMLRESWPAGWGAGCFRHGFPLYAAHHPEIYRSRPETQLYWEYTHNDFLQFAIELGLYGMCPLLLLILAALVRLGRARFWRSVVSNSLVLAVVLLGLHSTVDFVLQNPAILHTAGFLLIGALRWVELDAPATALRGSA